MIRREAEAVWRGPGKTGKGELSTQTGVLKGAQYSFGGRFAEGTGTNPEELIGAAHAGCFTMALAVQLEGAGYQPQELRTKASVGLEKQGDGFGIPEIRLTLNARIPEITEEKFRELAQKAKEGCPVSKLLRARIELDATLERG